ncbi:MAG: transglutaminase family protein [Caulobacteraceae bacterium]
MRSWRRSSATLSNSGSRPDMLFDIRHQTRYSYDAPVRESVMEVWVQPRQGGGQRLTRFALELDPPAQLFSYADFFGNAVYHFDVPQAHTGLTIQSIASVETRPPPEVPESLGADEWDRLRAGAADGRYFDYLRPHGFTVPTAILSDFMMSHGLSAPTGADPLAAVRALSSRLYEAFEYEAGVTLVDSPIDHALIAGRGVCQDFAQVMIAICRIWGVPARYVSGYLFTDASAGDRSDPDASHAWVDVFLPSLGWIGLDPTNDLIACERHIVVATGRDYGDVPPTRGVYKGGAKSELSVAVSVRQASAAAVDPEFMRTARAVVSSTGRRLPSSAALDQQLQQQ